MFFSSFGIHLVSGIVSSGFLEQSKNPSDYFFSSISRADELETALMEMVKQDNRRELSAKVNIWTFLVTIFLILSPTITIIQLRVVHLAYWA